MRKVVAYELSSLDGVAERPDAFFTDFDDVMRENLGRVIATQDTVLLGRRMYDEWAAYWPGSDIQPFANFINSVDKIVVTSTTPDLAWANSTVATGNLPELISELKQRSGGDIGVHGSIALTQSLLEAGLVDELRLVIAPAVHIHGRKLFDKGSPRRLTLTRHLASPSGYLLLDYQLETGHLEPNPLGLSDPFERTTGLGSTITTCRLLGGGLRVAEVAKRTAARRRARGWWLGR
jgi:dihydrofolate reductase